MNAQDAQQTIDRFEAKVDARMERGMNRAQAVRDVTVCNPKLHTAYIEASTHFTNRQRDRYLKNGRK